GIQRLQPCPGRMARLAAWRFRRSPGEPPAASEDLGSRPYPERYRHTGGLSSARGARARGAARARDGRLRSVDARRVKASGAFAVLLLVPLLAACTREAPEPEPDATDVPEELAGAGPSTLADSGIGTPIEDRVAGLGLLNDRDNTSRDLEMTPGEARRVGDVVVRLSACERTAPWEEPPETGAFVQINVLERADADSEPEWRRVFSGWLFKNSPSLNVVEHAIY